MIRLYDKHADMTVTSQSSKSVLQIKIHCFVGISDQTSLCQTPRTPRPIMYRDPHQIKIYPYVLPIHPDLD